MNTEICLQYRNTKGIHNLIGASLCKNAHLIQEIHKNAEQYKKMQKNSDKCRKIQKIQ
jgi:hypothetical protein